MAPPKTMAISQQQQQQHQQADNKQAAKPRKRKAKSNQASQQQQNHSESLEPVKSVPVAIEPVGGQPAPSAGAAATKAAAKTSAPTTVVPSERTTLKKQQVPFSVKEPTTVNSTENRRALPATVTPATITTPSVIGKHQQLGADEADDIDAGIELDGSSNSGSSVKDMSEDQIKSASVSPVMAQSNLINENCTSSTKQQNAEVAPIEQPNGSLCSAVSQTTTTAAATTTTVKKISTTKQQLAANQQVIDADERQLQQKLQNKQKKSQETSQETASNAPIDSSGPAKSTDRQSQGGGDQTTGSDKTNRLRRFSSQSRSDSQDGSNLCKVCEQHVYQMERMLAEKSVYHKRCFRCHQCKVQLRVDNYSSHEGQVYCKAHHRQIFQPQVKLDSEDDVDIVAKSTNQPVDDYLLHRGRLSELSFSFLQPKQEGILKRQMIICENEPAELPKDVVRSDTKLDDGIEQLNLNLNNILEKFERGTASNDEESQPSSAGVVIEKPSFNIKQTLLAFESRLANDDNSEPKTIHERPAIKKLTNLNGFLNRQSSQEKETAPVAQVKPLPVRRSESLMMRLKKYESRIAGEQVEDDEDEGSDDDVNNNQATTPDVSEDDEGGSRRRPRGGKGGARDDSKKLTSINLSSLKSQWENGDINKRRDDDDDDNDVHDGGNKNHRAKVGKLDAAAAIGLARDNNNCNGVSASAEKNEELIRIRQQLARKKSGESVRNIYENAIRDAQQQQLASRRESNNDMSALNGFSTSSIQQQLLQQQNGDGSSNNNINNTNNNNGQSLRTPTTPNKDHFQLNFSNKANKLKEKFELGLITNSSRDDSDLSDDEETPALTKLEQIRQEKLEDLSVFTDGEIKAREARSLFQQIDRRISAASGATRQVNPKSLASIGASMKTKLTNQMNSSSSNGAQKPTSQAPQQQVLPDRVPIRLTNNVKT